MQRKSLFWTACFAAILVLLSIIIKIRNANADFGILGKISRIPNFDKFGHFFVMGSLGYCAVAAARAWAPDAGWKFTAKVMAILALASGIEECSQAWSPTRTLSFADFAASVAGITFFGWLAHRHSKTGISRPSSAPPAESP